MPHFPKPFFRKSRGLWYVQIQGQQLNLGPDKNAAFEAYYTLMKRPRARVVVNSESVAALVDQFLEWVSKNLAADTYRWYKDRLQLFVKRYPDLVLSDLKRFHVRQWIDSYDVSPGTKRNFARSIVRCLNWCAEEELIEASPIAHFKKPRGGKREKIISPLEYRLILDAVRNEAFRDLIVVTWETGCRPQESLIVESRHVDLPHSRWHFPASESKGKLSERVVYLTPDALAITKRLMLRHQHGPLFRNTTGEPWTTEAVNCAFIALQTRLGLQKLALPIAPRNRIPAELKADHEVAVVQRRKERNALAREIGPKYCLYHFRHTWMNRLLTSGVDSLTVAVLAGHTDPSTLAKTYQHLSQNPQFLLQQASRAS